MGGTASGGGGGGVGGVRRWGGGVDRDHAGGKYSRQGSSTGVAPLLLDQAYVQELGRDRPGQDANPNVVGLEVSM